MGLLSYQAGDLVDFSSLLTPRRDNIAVIYPPYQLQARRFQGITTGLTSGMMPDKDAVKQLADEMYDVNGFLLSLERVLWSAYKSARAGKLQPRNVTNPNTRYMPRNVISLPSVREDFCLSVRVCPCRACIPATAAQHLCCHRRHLMLTTTQIGGAFCWHAFSSHPTSSNWSSSSTQRRGSHRTASLSLRCSSRWSGKSRSVGRVGYRMPPHIS
jgi:hypothetical protein